MTNATTQSTQCSKIWTWMSVKYLLILSIGNQKLIDEEKVFFCNISYLFLVHCAKISIVFSVFSVDMHYDLLVVDRKLHNHVWVAL